MGPVGTTNRSCPQGLHGIHRHDVRTEVATGRWLRIGAQSIAVRRDLDEVSRRWAAVFDVGAGARLDGVTALQQAGLAGWNHHSIDISVPHGTRIRRVERARVRAVRRLEPPVAGGIPRTRPEIAAIRAAAWATSDRQAGTLVAMTIEQRLTTPARLMAAWRQHGLVRRHRLIDQVIADVCDGAESLGELDFARLCRKYGLPKPDRQVVVETKRGRIYLDVRWTDLHIVVEIEGAHHALTPHSIDDSLRQNALLIDGDRVLRIPVIGFRCHEREFMTQVAAVIAAAQRRQVAGW
ncbi:hypothetical protein [Leekyejoonella antrihumi]|uniref:DUF559 domain-containing protein n=1 Tax=Leekyejoonella antrihumi TaxID=1660198 RepID=A0A563E0Q0_9MICO|nr:hypothetical protein [Leekyejoonella antrihumi]TWP35965.1 hypothetical protein FGL98_12085 [Leekyejoonella antrihumi]